MKTSVDKNVCIGCEVCVGIAPDVYKMENGTAVPVSETISPNRIAEAKEACESCPVSAISLE
jgi:ferredoxin